jgi:tetratricopeptide (TPR) repeat protein
VFEH